MKNKKAAGLQNVFIVGCPRSGKTLLQQSLAFHPEFGWFSQYLSRLRFLPLTGALNRIYSIPVIGGFLASRDKKFFLPHPVEMRKDCNTLLEKKGSLGEKDVIEEDKINLRKLFETQLKIQNKNMFITDYGRPARMLYFKKIFPGSKFIHIMRDGRDVTASFLKDRPQWFTEKRDLFSYYYDPPVELTELLSKYKGTKNYIMALAALRWKTAVLELEKQEKKLNSNCCLVVKYEDLVKDRFKVIQKCLGFLNLKFTAKLKKVLDSKKLYHESIWESYFNKREKKVLNEILNDILEKYDYMPKMK